MTKLRASILAIGMAGVAMALAPATAHADIITFTVDEGAVPGAQDINRTVNGITGKYEEAVTLTGAGCTPLTIGCSSGAFSANLVVRFSDYTLNGPTVTSQVAPRDPAAEAINDDNYQLYALVTVSGNFFAVPFPGDPNSALFVFDPNLSTANVWTDPGRDTTLNFLTATATVGTPDQHILTANTLDNSGTVSNGQVRVCINPAGCGGGSTFGSVLSGSYALTYLDPSLVAPDGPLYWLGLASLTFTATASGDVDPFNETPPGGFAFPGHVQGDTSIALNTTAVPEPASLTLFGLGLAAARFARRRKNNAA